MNCKLIKLKSGEDLICDLSQPSQTKYILNNPYVFRNTTMLNFDTGIPYEMTVVRDWLNLSSDKKITISSTNITAVYSPSPESKELYVKEIKKSKEKKLKSAPVVPPSSEIAVQPPATEKFQNDVLSMMDKLFKGFEEIAEQASIEDDMDNAMDDAMNDSMTPEDMYNQMMKSKSKRPLPPRPMIQMSLIFPPEVLIELMDSGIINVNDVKKITKDVKKKLRYTGDEKHRPDFGNKLTDWNSDPNSKDYK